MLSDPFFERVARALPQLDQPWLALAGGRTNAVWRVGDLVIKRHDPSAASTLFPNDPAAEAAALARLGPLDLCPRLRAAGPDWVAYDHYPGATWAEDPAAVARLLGRLHQTGIAHAPFRICPGGSRALLAQTGQMMAAVALRYPLPELPQIPPPPPCLLHGDVVAGNIIDGPDGLRLIDWQCPAIGDPAEDVSTFLSPAMQIIYRGAPLSAQDEQSFLSAYPLPFVAERYLALRPAYHLRMAAHCLWRAARGDAGYAAAARAEFQALASV